MRVRVASMFLFTIFHLSFMLFVNYICPFHEFMKGVRCKRITRCISSVGLYVPGGTAVLPSTALMLAVVCLPLPNSLNLTDCNDSLFKTSQLVSLSASLHRLLDAKLLFLPHPLVVMVAYARYTFGSWNNTSTFFSNCLMESWALLFPAGGSLLCQKSWCHTHTESWRSSGSSRLEIVLWSII